MHLEFKCFCCICSEKLLKDVNEEIWFSELVSIWLMLEWRKSDWTIKFMAWVISKVLISRAKWLVFFFRCLFDNMLRNLRWISRSLLCYLWLLHYQFLRLFLLCQYDPYLWEKTLLSSENFYSQQHHLLKYS